MTTEKIKKTNSKTKEIEEIKRTKRTKRTKKYFGTDGIRGIYTKEPLTEEIIKKVSKALAIFLSKKYSEKNKNISVLIARDTRASGKRIKEIIVKELNKRGINTTNLGIVSTPGLALLTKNNDYNAGIMITASHNPAEYNGIKIFDSEGKKLSDEEELTIEELMFEKPLFKEDEETQKKGLNLSEEELKKELKKSYASKITSSELNNFKVVLDCANGAAYELAPKVLGDSGAEVIIMGNSPDGNNINKECGALFPKKLSEKVVEEKADIGIALDGDADRIIVVDEQGTEVNGDKIIAIIATHMNKRNELKNNGVVVTHYSNLGFDEAMNKQGIKVERVGIGDQIVRTNMDFYNHNLGGEQSGHIILSDYVPGGDGLLVGIKLLEIMKKENKKMSQLSEVMKDWPQKQEAIMVKEKIPLKKINGLKELRENLLKKINGKGRIYLRYSGTESKLRVMTECKNKELLEEVSNEIMTLLKRELEV